LKKKIEQSSIRVGARKPTLCSRRWDFDVARSCDSSSMSGETARSENIGLPGVDSESGNPSKQSSATSEIELTIGENELVSEEVREAVSYR
jgi:hypothetical protein